MLFECCLGVLFLLFLGVFGSLLGVGGTVLGTFGGVFHLAVVWVFVGCFLGGLSFGECFWAGMFLGGVALGDVFGGVPLGDVFGVCLGVFVGCFWGPGCWGCLLNVSGGGLWELFLGGVE